MLDFFEAWLVVMVNGKPKEFQLSRRDGSPMFLTQSSAEKAVSGALDSCHKGFVIKRSCVREFVGKLKPGEVPEQIKRDLDRMAGDPLGLDPSQGHGETGSKDDIL
jgi:hypothetical protein